MIPAEHIARSIVVVRGRRVLLDADLARLYGVETRVLAQAVSRNSDRFPGDFMFRLTRADLANLRSQIVISRAHGGRKVVFDAIRQLMTPPASRSRRVGFGVGRDH